MALQSSSGEQVEGESIESRIHESGPNCEEEEEEEEDTLWGRMQTVTEQPAKKVKKRAHLSANNGTCVQYVWVQSTLAGRKA